MIVGIQRGSPASLLPHKTYVCFSHVIKGRDENTPYLAACLERDIRLIDYQRIIDPDTTKRRVSFGFYAGFAGVVDSLHALGQRFLSQGYSTPLLSMGRAFTYPSLEAARRALVEAGEEHARLGLLAPMCPLMFVFTGTGNVHRGAARGWPSSSCCIGCCTRLNCPTPPGCANTPKTRII